MRHIPSRSKAMPISGGLWIPGSPTALHPTEEEWVEVPVTLCQMCNEVATADPCLDCELIPGDGEELICNVCGRPFQKPSEGWSGRSTCSQRCSRMRSTHHDLFMRLSEGGKLIVEDTSPGVEPS